MSRERYIIEWLDWLSESKTLPKRIAVIRELLKSEYSHHPGHGMEEYGPYTSNDAAIATKMLP